MKSSRPYVVLTGILIGALSAGIAVRVIRPNQIWINQPLHSTVEALGGLAAIAMAFVLFARTREQADPKAQAVAVGFLGMGLLECFHAVSPPGHGFVLLRSVASLLGGVAFAVAWAPESVLRPAASRWVPRIIVAGAIFLGLWTLIFPQHVPHMIRSGEFAGHASALNGLAATLFFAGAIGFLAEKISWRYASSSRWQPQLLSILRIMTAFLFMQHGLQKLFGIPSPPPMGTVPLFSLMGLAGVLELFGGLLILVGLFTPPVAFILSGQMAVAYFMAHAPQGFWPILNKGELAVRIALYFSTYGQPAPAPGASITSGGM